MLGFHASGFTRQHAAVKRLATNIDGVLISGLKDQELVGLFLALVTFASRDNYQAALLEWADQKLSFRPDTVSWNAMRYSTQVWGPVYLEVVSTSSLTPGLASDITSS